MNCGSNGEGWDGSVAQGVEIVLRNAPRTDRTRLDECLEEEEKMNDVDRHGKAFLNELKRNFVVDYRRRQDDDINAGKDS